MKRINDRLNGISDHVKEVSPLRKIENSFENSHKIETKINNHRDP